MDTSIYIGTQALQAVCGAAGKKGIVITDYASIPLPEGALINGVITDEQAVAGAVQALVRQHPTLPMKAVQLTLDSSLIYFKQALLPNLPKHKMQALVAGEFADVEGANELLCDYAVLERNGEQGGVNALLSAVKRDLVGSYLELFSSLGITLSGLNTALNCQIKLVHTLPQLAKETFIMLVLDGNVLGSSLYISGKFRFANRTRLFAERGTPALAEEIERTVSTMLQFHLSQKSGVSVSHLYLCGMQPQEASIHPQICRAFGLKQGDFSALGTMLRVPDQSFDLAQYLYAAGNLIRL